MELKKEAAAIAKLIFQDGENQIPDDASRKRLGEECGKLSLAGLRPYAGSLDKDPSQASNYYLAADALKDGAATPLLLHFSLTSGKAASLFSRPGILPTVEHGKRQEDSAKRLSVCVHRSGKHPPLCRKGKQEVSPPAAG